MPIFLAQGSTDNRVPPRVTEEYRARLCRAGSRVAFDRVPGVGHLSMAEDAAPAALDRIGDRSAGVRAPSECGEP
ncbi:lipase family protein [Methylobacterium sp. BK227]|uniref:alpha/beta hydrolase family protein n=1 Tax=Methylobacterium oryzae TaxID=334852 RepID=UPI00104E6023